MRRSLAALLVLSAVLGACKLGPNAVPVEPDYPPSAPFSVARDAGTDR